MEEEGRCLVETFEDKQKELKGVREFIRLPIMYHPDSTSEAGNGFQCPSPPRQRACEDGHDPQFPLTHKRPKDRDARFAFSRDR